VPGIRLDGVLDEDAWRHADAIDNLTMLEPVQGGTPTGRTRVRVLANAHELVFGIECDDRQGRGACAGRSRPVGDLLVIYNHNVRDFGAPLGWAKDSNHVLVKLQYATDAAGPLRATS
jgi:hypothetical protein